MLDVLKNVALLTGAFALCVTGYILFRKGSQWKEPLILAVICFFIAAVAGTDALNLDKYVDLQTKSKHVRQEKAKDPKDDIVVKLNNEVGAVVFEDEIEKIEAFYRGNNVFHAEISLLAQESLNNEMTKEDIMEKNIAVFQHIYTSDLPIKSVTITNYLEYADKKGNTKHYTAVKINLSKIKADGINWDDVNKSEFDKKVDKIFVNQLLR